MNVIDIFERALLSAAFDYYKKLIGEEKALKLVREVYHKLRWEKEKKLKERNLKADTKSYR